MEPQQIAVLVLAAIVLSAMFGGPVAAVIGLWLIRRERKRPVHDMNFSVQTITCPHCHKRFRGRVYSHGNVAKCPYCSAALPVPSALSKPRGQ